MTLMVDIRVVVAGARYWLAILCARHLRYNDYNLMTVVLIEYIAPYQQ